MGTSNALRHSWCCWRHSRFIARRFPILCCVLSSSSLHAADRRRWRWACSVDVTSVYLAASRALPSFTLIRDVGLWYRHIDEVGGRRCPRGFLQGNSIDTHTHGECASFASNEDVVYCVPTFAAWLPSSCNDRCKPFSSTSAKGPRRPALGARDSCRAMSASPDNPGLPTKCQASMGTHAVSHAHSTCNGRPGT